MQSRITLMPGAETEISAYEPPTGAGIRVDSGVEKGRKPSGSYDPLLFKLIVWSSKMVKTIIRALTLLAEERKEGGPAANAASA